jgi:transcriptional regulator with XRE-family HTH domain
MTGENLSQFLQRVMKQKAMSARDIERKTGKKIDNSYISKILNGAVTNPSAKAMVLLAEGLGIDPHEVFTAVTGYELPQHSAAPDPLVLVDLMQRMATNPQLIELLQVWAGLPREQQVPILESLKLLRSQESGPHMDGRGFSLRKG